MSAAEPFALQPVPDCLACGQPGRTLYTGLRDTQTSLEGDWSVSRCDRCDLLWVNPRPAPEVFAKLYQGDYYTHETALSDWDTKLVAGERLDDCSFSDRLQLALFARYLGRDPRAWGVKAPRALVGLLWALPHVRDVVGGRVGWLPPRPGARLLDVGCGGGSFLALMRFLGWDVTGVDADPLACDAGCARFGLRVHHGDLGSLPCEPGTFDVVTSIHAIEHMQQPFTLIAQGLDMLRPGGRMVVVTPNATGLGHRWFRSAFADLLPPRHLYLFSGKVLARHAETLGARVIACRTTARRGHTVWVDSRHIRRRGRLPSHTPRWRKLTGVPFQLVEALARVFDPMAGDELVLVLERP